jgi:hypothetical protein
MIKDKKIFPVLAQLVKKISTINIPGFFNFLLFLINSYFDVMKGKFSKKLYYYIQVREIHWLKGQNYWTI